MSIPDKAAIIAKDLADGCDEIGVFLGKSAPQSAYLCRRGEIPGYKLAGRWQLRPSRYYRHIEDKENATLSQRPVEQAAQRPSG